MTATEIQASAKLKIGEKNTKWSPPQMGIHVGKTVSMMGK